MRSIPLMALTLAALVPSLVARASAPGPAAGLRRLEHGWQVLSVAFSRDGNWLTSGSADRTAKLWNARTGAPARTLPEEC
jgi:WD40 repeat protein